MLTFYPRSLQLFQEDSISITITIPSPSTAYFLAVRLGAGRKLSNNVVHNLNRICCAPPLEASCKILAQEGAQSTWPRIWLYGCSQGWLGCGDDGRMLGYEHAVSHYANEVKTLQAHMSAENSGREWEWKWVWVWEGCGCGCGCGYSDGSGVVKN